MALGLNLDQVQSLALGQLRKLCLGGGGLSVALLILAFLVGGEEATEGDDGPTRHELGVRRRGLRRNVDGRR